MNPVSRRIIKLAVDIEDEIRRASGTNPYDVLSGLGLAATVGGAATGGLHGYMQYLDALLREAPRSRAIRGKLRAFERNAGRLEGTLNQIEKQVAKTPKGHVPQIEAPGKFNRRANRIALATESGLERLAKIMSGERQFKTRYPSWYGLGPKVIPGLAKPVVGKAGLIAALAGLLTSTGAGALADWRRQHLMDLALREALEGGEGLT
jgi:hypothetical protein